MTMDDKLKVGWLLLTIWVLIGAALLCVIIREAIRESEAELVIQVTDARLVLSKLRPDLQLWYLELEVRVTPPTGHVMLFQGGDVNAVLGNASATPMLIPIIEGGPHSGAISTVFQVGGRPRGLFCEGGVYEDIAPDSLKPPSIISCQFNMSDATRFTASASFELVARNENEWCLVAPPGRYFVEVQGARVQPYNN